MKSDEYDESDGSSVSSDGKEICKGGKLAQFATIYTIFTVYCTANVMKVLLKHLKIFKILQLCTVYCSCSVNFVQMISLPPWPLKLQCTIYLKVHHFHMHNFYLILANVANEYCLLTVKATGIGTQYQFCICLIPLFLLWSLIWYHNMRFCWKLVSSGRKVQLVNSGAPARYKRPR